MQVTPQWMTLVVARRARACVCVCVCCKEERTEEMQGKRLAEHCVSISKTATRFQSEPNQLGGIFWDKHLLSPFKISCALD